MKISVIIDISVIWFHKYIGDISTDVLIQNIGKVKINENYENIKKNSKKNYIRSKNRHFKVIFF